jgi:hypothetical protein
MRLEIEVPYDVASQVREFLGGDSTLERGGFLLGRSICGVQSVTKIACFVPCPDAPSSSTSLTFRPEEWQLAHAHPAVATGEAEIVGWVHSHPGMPVGMSSRDVFIHRHFFSGEGQVSWIRDPLADSECFWQLVDGEPRAVSATVIRGHR